MKQYDVLYLFQNNLRAKGSERVSEGNENETKFTMCWYLQKLGGRWVIGVRSEGWGGGKRGNYTILLFVTGIPNLYSSLKQTNKQKTHVSNSEELSADLGSNLLGDSGIHLHFIKPSISPFVIQGFVDCKHWVIPKNLGN